MEDGPIISQRKKSKLTSREIPGAKFEVPCSGKSKDGRHAASEEKLIH